jgi:hypothetical protein
MNLRAVIALVACSLIAAVAVAGEPPTPQAAARKAELDRKVGQQDAQVHKLQQDVASEEAKSRAAQQRGQQQDQTIEDLRRELKAAQAGQSGGSH